MQKSENEMTLFKKVFDSHFTDDVHEADPGPSSQQLPDAPVSGASSEAVPMDRQSFASHFEDHREDAPKAAPAPAVDAPAEEEMSMAERAALAHSQMRQPASAQPASIPAAEPDPLAMLRPSAVSAPMSHDAEPLTPEPPVAQEPAPQPEAQPSRRPGGRVKTRLLGFHHSTDINSDPFQNANAETPSPSNLFPSGWLVVVAGPGEGNALPVYGGVSTIGRGDDQALKLDFGDTSISRQNHAAVAYDSEQNKFFLGHGGKSNIIRLNDRPVLSTEELGHADILRIGETTLRFVALCGADFSWDGAANAE